jgi:hypothetical protein
MAYVFGVDCFGKDIGARRSFEHRQIARDRAIREPAGHTHAAPAALRESKS